MDFSDIRPVVSGLIGAAIAAGLCAAWARWLPRHMNGKSAATLAHQHRWPIRLANTGFMAGLGAGLCLYQWGGYASNDWRPLGLGFGTAFTLPLLLLPLVAWARRASAAEAYVAFAASQKVPLALLYPLLLLGPPLLGWSLAHL